MGKHRPGYQKKYYHDHREELLARAKKRHKTPEYQKLRRAWNERNKEKLKQQAREYFQKNKKRINERRNKRRYELWLTIIKKLGGKCARCGFDDLRALQIDHINGGGTKESRQIGTHQMYINILKMSKKERESKYQILCANCNNIKMRERGEFRRKA